MRCLTLASSLRARDVDVSFACREWDGDLCHLVEQLGFAVSRLSAFAGEHITERTFTGRDRLGTTWQEDAEQTQAVIETFPERLERVEQ